MAKRLINNEYSSHYRREIRELLEKLIELGHEIEWIRDYLNKWLDHRKAEQDKAIAKAAQ